jgi:DNA polymerase II small subunit
MNVMQDSERLQKALQITMNAGYQLNKDAFDFLSMLSPTEDPAKVIEEALKRIETFADKPLFIDRALIEELLDSGEPNKEIAANQDAAQTPTDPTVIPQEPGLPQLTEAKRIFHPLAKEIQSEFNVIEDPSTKLTSNGTIDDYLGYFRDRFTRMDKLLRHRIDVKSAATVVDALRAEPNVKLKIIGMITEKREVKQRIILNVEDLQANITALVPQNASEDLHKKAHMLLLDQVVCLSVAKTRSNLVIVEDITFPDVPQRTPHKATTPVYAVLTSDLHIGSTKFQRDSFNRFILWLNGKFGNSRMQEIAGQVKYVIIAGDVVDGIGVYPNQIRELAIKDINKQYRLAAGYFEQIPDYIEVIVTPGNHDSPRKVLPQPAISNEMLKSSEDSRDIRSLGSPCLISVHGVEVLVYHGRSIDDLNSTIAGLDNDHPERAMKLLLQCRHLAPVYGGKTLLSPEDRDSLVIERIPDIFHAGHIHALGYTNYRGILIVNSGGWQDQTDYMKKLGFMPTPSKVPVVNLQTLELTTIAFN